MQCAGFENHQNCDERTNSLNAPTIEVDNRNVLELKHGTQGQSKSKPTLQKRNEHHNMGPVHSLHFEGSSNDDNLNFEQEVKKPCLIACSRL